MRLFRTALAAWVLCVFAAGPALAQEEGEDEASINQAFAAIMASMPREGNLIKVPYVSHYGHFGNLKTEMVDDPTVPGHKAYRVFAEKSRNDWEQSVVSPVGPAVQKGDLLAMIVYMRVEEGSPDVPFFALAQNSPPFSPLINSSATVESGWNVYMAQGKADKNYKQDSLSMTIHLGNADHTIDLGPVFVINLGQ